ncbi:uncharacterized protein LOC135493332 [Lineus longissimus]|uniref:uncharacterized protein LOC135493332 n=1 Tax=Lineus longissimus TaxID=88925 RepID=UPI002B4D8E62
MTKTLGSLNNNSVLDLLVPHKANNIHPLNRQDGDEEGEPASSLSAEKTLDGPQGYVAANVGAIQGSPSQHCTRATRTSATRTRDTRTRDTRIRDSKDDIAVYRIEMMAVEKIQPLNQDLQFVLW